MDKFKINNIYMSDGKTLDEIITKFIITFLDESSDIVFNN